MFELLSDQLPWLLLIAFLAGGIDAAVGGGGLVQLPGLFTALPQHSPSLLLGSNKFTSMFGTAAAAWRYARRIHIPWRPVLYAAAAAFACSFLGATTVSLLPRDAVRPLVLVLLIAMLAYTLLKKDFGALHRPRHIGRRELAIAIGLGGAIGFYDGFFGPGTGSFLIFLFIRFFGLDFLSASASSKIVNLATNVAALCWFLPAGNVLLAIALPMAVANVAGSVTGSWMALRGGTALIRKLFVVLVVILIIRMGWDTIAPLL
jgi:uncharacterized membrane protein YfcA